MPAPHAQCLGWLHPMLRLWTRSQCSVCVACTPCSVCVACTTHVFCVVCVPAPHAQIVDPLPMLSMCGLHPMLSVWGVCACGTPLGPLKGCFARGLCALIPEKGASRLARSVGRSVEDRSSSEGRSSSNTLKAAKRM